MEDGALENPAIGSAFRVLSLDGGGVMGTYTASVLAELERMSDKRIVDHFDLIVGTSTGGIVAVGLGLGIPAQKLLDLYVENGAAIFPRVSRWRTARALGFLKSLFRPKHSQQVLKAVVEEILGDKRLGESRTRLVIPAFNADKGAIQLFKTAHRHDYKQDYLLPATSIVMSTSAAPSYYSAYTDSRDTCYLDGGVWANCPVMVGITEAICVLERPIDSISMLSIGTTSAPYHVDAKRRNGGLISWGTGEAISLFMQAQANAALGQAELFLKDRFLRIDVLAKPQRFAMDDATAIPELKSLGIDDARKLEGTVNRMFLNRPVDPFEPCFKIAVQG